ncbi:hypothetical protein CGCS363_v012506 [Colletotrichum siamense]|uniref:uncharacterized protein n=1 Tax=Colletotrichum siamense TaxID=690259 RepID=UPI001872A716|nr:uncharacterized protein CGCS363_v012506 [Colletotrichum siamense]KAF5489370.1 hypothetical protein CGCS363_v012506 [Colletotrichum siamense]
MGLLLDPKLSKPSESDYWGTPDDGVGLSGCYNEYNQAVHAEIGSTSIITKAGYKADALLTSFHKDTDPETYCASIMPDVQDTLREGAYFGFSVHPYETIFLKTNRGISPSLVASFTQWSDDMGYSSYERCKA